MRKIFSLISILISIHAFGQDTIVKKTGDLLPAKVIAIDQFTIKYTRTVDQNETPYEIEKSLVSEIRFQNGTKDVFNTVAPSGQAPPATAVATEYARPTETSSANVSKDLYRRGQEDADKYYNGYHGAGTGTLITSLVSPLLGLAPAIACSSTKPKDENLNYRSAEKMNDADYSRGYRAKAKKIKQGKVWMNWSIGFAVNVIAVLALQ